MTEDYSVLSKLNELGNPYTLERMHPRLSWWLADRLGRNFKICYDGQVIRTICESHENARDIVALLNVVYQVGAADALSLAARG
jgi:hypothetical protein